MLALCALAIKLDSPGPVLFRQRRIGRDDQPFEVLKFRSMREDADKHKDGVAALNLHGGGTETGCSRSERSAGDPRRPSSGATRWTSCRS